MQYTDSINTLLVILNTSQYGTCGFTYNFNDIHNIFTNIIRPPGSLPLVAPLVKQKIQLVWPYAAQFLLRDMTKEEVSEWQSTQCSRKEGLFKIVPKYKPSSKSSMLLIAIGMFLPTSIPKLGVVMIALVIMTVGVRHF